MILKEYISSEDMDLAMLSIHYLMYANNKQPFIESVQAAIDTEHEKMREQKDRPYFLASAFQDFLGSMNLVPNTLEYER